MISHTQLWPAPQHVRALNPGFQPPKTWSLAPGADLLCHTGRQALCRELAAWDQSLAAAQGDTPAVHHLRYQHREDLGHEAYQLLIDERGVLIQASGAPGFFYATHTLIQWLRLHRLHQRGTLAGLHVEDAPAFTNRGVMLDISRNKVPEMDTLFALIDWFAGLKINQLQLYMEHSFAYTGHEVVWEQASPITPEELAQLRSYCEQRHIALVPNQNCFGHFHRWLVHEPYRQLAECPEGIEHPFSPEPEPFSLCATDPGSLLLIEDLLDQLLPHFNSPWLNVGLDETFDLGTGRSQEICAERGKTQVYLDYLQRIHAMAARRNCRLMFWGDIIVAQPQYIGQLPRDVVALEWGYEADHPFDEHGAAFANSGLDYYVCPGTSSWNSFAGRLSNALENLKSAAKSGKKHGAAGYLITDWGDRGHLQPLPISYPGFLAGASAAWNADKPLGMTQLSQALDHHLWHSLEGTPTQALMHLGETWKLGGAQPLNGSALFFLWWFSHETLEFERVCGLTHEDYATIATHLRHAQSLLEAIREPWSLEKAELAWVTDMLEWCRDLGKKRLDCGLQTPLSALPAEQHGELEARMQDLMQRRKALWMKRNRSGGWHITQRYALLKIKVDT